MVKLLYISPLWLISNGIRQSHDTTDKADSYWLDASITNCPYCGSDNIKFSLSVYGCNITGLCLDCRANLQIHIGKKDYSLVKRVGFKFKHESILEHSLLVFEFEASRALLQELSRSRVGISPTVKSTRYTLKELKDEPEFDWSIGREALYKRASKYLYLVPDKDSNIYNSTNTFSIKALENLRQLIQKRTSNDISKYALPESFKFKGQYSFNLRSLVHLLKLRIDKSALKEFRLLCKDIINSLPLEWKELVLLDEQIKKNYKELNNE